MFNFTKTGRSPGILARLAAFGHLFAPERNANPPLYRYARRYYMRYHRGNFGIKASDYVIQIIIAAVILYAVSTNALGSESLPEQGTLLISGAAVIFSLSATIHAIAELGHCAMEATKFADDAILKAETEAEVDEYFREIYPFTIYDA